MTGKRLFSLLLLPALLLSACSQRTIDAMYENRTLTVQYTLKNADVSASRDYTSLAGAIEIADLIVIGTVTQEHHEAVYLYQSGTLDFTFFYEIAVEEVLLDRLGGVEIGSTVSLCSEIGMIQARAFQEQYPNRVETPPLSDSEYYTYVSKGALPIENGYSFLLFLDSTSLTETGYYTDATWTQVYGIRGTQVFWGKNGEPWLDPQGRPGTVTALKETVRAAIEGQGGGANP